MNDREISTLQEKGVVSMWGDEPNPKIPLTSILDGLDQLGIEVTAVTIRPLGANGLRIEVQS